MVMVIDNSHDGRWRDTIFGSFLSVHCDYRYIHEPEVGLAHVRNRAVHECIREAADLIVFLDDDQTPRPDLLEEMVAALDSTGANVVLGAVKAVFDQPPPGWIARGGYFDICRHADGDVIDYADTSNVVVDLTFVRRSGIKFCERFNFSGAEDTLFFRQLHRAGAKIVFSSRSVVYEHIVQERAKLFWLMKRWRWTGNTCARIERELDRSSPVRLLLGGLARFTAGIGLFVACLPAATIGRFDLAAPWLRVVCRGWGWTEAACGHVDEAYRVPDH